MSTLKIIHTPNNTLKIEKQSYLGTLGMGYLLKSLRNSDLFTVETHSDHLKTQRGERGTTLYFNDKKIYLDLWEYFNPTHSMDVYEANFDLIIKLQHAPISIEEYEKKCRRKNVLQRISAEEREKFYNKIIPWTFFPSTDLMKFMEAENCPNGPVSSLPEQHLAFFSGKNWKGRHSWCDMLEKQEGVYIVRHDGNNSQQKRMKRGVYHMDTNTYLNNMRSSKYGLVLSGRGSLLTQAKNRREIDYMIMKKPLLVNYDPYYYDRLIEGVHYIRLQSDTNIADLEDKYDLNQMVENAYEWYKNNASPIGVARSFLNIMHSEFKSDIPIHYEI